MTSRLISDVRHFMQVMGQDTPQQLTHSDLNLTFRLVTEEHREFLDAYDSLDFKLSNGGMTKEEVKKAYGDLIDACIDSIYVHIGALIRMGCDVEAHWNEVQRSNMAKQTTLTTYDPLTKISLSQTLVVRDEHGKVQKPADWTPPDHAPILAKRMEE